MNDGDIVRRRTYADAAVREGGAAVFLYLDVPRECGDIVQRLVVVQRQLAARHHEHRFREDEKTPVAIAPVAHAFRAVAVGGITRREERHGLFYGREYFRAVMAILHENHRGDDELRMADGIPVVAADCPPLAACDFACSDDMAVGGEHAALDFFANAFARRGLEFVLQPPVVNGESGAEIGTEKIRIRSGAVEIPQISVMGGQHPALFIEESIQFLFDGFEKTSLVFKDFRLDEREEAVALPLEIDAFVVAAVANSKELQIKLIRQFRNGRADN